MTVRSIDAPAHWAGLTAAAQTWTETPGDARVETLPYIGSNGDAAVLLEVTTASGYATVALPLAAARLVARAIATAADEARDDFPAELAQYRRSFGL